LSLKDYHYDYDIDCDADSDSEYVQQLKLIITVAIVNKYSKNHS